MSTQLAHHLPAAEEGIFEKQFIDVHQRQVLRALCPGRVIERGTADRQKPALMVPNAQVAVAGRDHRLALAPAHRLSPPAKKSRSTINWPILA